MVGPRRNWSSLWSEALVASIKPYLYPQCQHSNQAHPTSYAQAIGTEDRTRSLRNGLYNLKDRFILKTLGFWLYESAARCWAEDTTWSRLTRAWCGQWRKQSQVTERPLGTISLTVLALFGPPLPQWSFLVPTLGLRFWHHSHSAEPLKLCLLDPELNHPAWACTTLTSNLSSSEWEEGYSRWRGCHVGDSSTRGSWGIGNRVQLSSAEMQIASFVPEA